MRSLILALTLCSSVSAMATGFPVFWIRKPVKIEDRGKPENFVKVFIDVDMKNGCEPGDIGFACGQNNDSCVKPPNALLHCYVMAGLKEIPTNPEHPAA